MEKMNSKKQNLSRISLMIQWVLHHKTTVFLILFFFITNLSLTIFNGSRVCIDRVCGIYIGGLHWHDALWHLAIGNTAFVTYPFQIPIFSPAPLIGYNYFFDLIIFLLTKIGVSSIVSYFKIVPILFCCFFAVLSYLYLSRINKSTTFINSVLFFLFFGSSFSYVLSIWHFGRWQSFMYAQAMQSGRALLNMQYAVSLLFLLSSLILLQEKKLSSFKTILLGVFLFTSFGLKFYGGAVLMMMLLVNSFIRLVKNKKPIQFLFQIGVYSSGFVAAMMLFYMSSSSTKGDFPFIFSPFSIVHSLIEERDMFMPQLVLSRYVLQSAHKLFSVRLIAIELFSAAIFLVYNMGTRVVGVYCIVDKLIRKKLTEHEIILLSGILFSTLMTLFFIQNGDWWNIIQFFGYSLFLLNIFSGEMLARLLVSKKWFLLVFGFIIILLTLPTNIEQISFSRERYISIPDNELSVLTLLQEKPYGVVMQLPVSDTSYVSAFSHKPLYFADKGVLNIVGVDYQGREKEMMHPENIDLLKNNIDYIYLNKQKYTGSGEFFLRQGFQTIFNNQSVWLLQRK